MAIFISPPKNKFTTTSCLSNKQLYLNFYACALKSETKPIIARTGIASFIKPTTTSAINANGRRKTVTSIDAIPHDALIANINNFPNTTNIKTTNNKNNNLLTCLSCSTDYSFCKGHTLDLSNPALIRNTLFCFYRRFLPHFYTLVNETF